MPLCGKTLFSSLALCAALISTANMSAQDGSPSGKCSMQPLNIPSPAGTTTAPTDLNDKGAIVGFLAPTTGPTFHITGFLFSNGKFTHFRFPGSADTMPFDINIHGVIVGSFDHATDTSRAFMAHNGVFQEVKIPGFPNATATATGINDLGDITGQFQGNGSDFGFLLHNGKLTIISFPGAKGGTFPTSINNSGVVVGTYHLFADEGQTHGFMWKNGNFTNIQPGLGSTFPKKINDKGDIVGTFFDDKGTHGFSFDKGRYSIIDGPISLGTELNALNNFDNVLGFFESAKENIQFKGFCSSLF